MLLPITASTAAALAMLLLVLAILTVRQRFRLKAGFGDAGDWKLIAASRSHANLAEHAPIVLIMLALLEYSLASATVLSWTAGAFVVGRVLHAVGLHTASKPGTPPLARQIGVIITWSVMVGLAAMIMLRVMGV